MEHPGVGTLNRLGKVEIAPVLDRGASTQDDHRNAAKQGGRKVGEMSHWW